MPIPIRARSLVTSAAIAAGLAIGAAGIAGAASSTTTSPSTTSPAPATAPHGPGDPARAGHGPGETLLTGTAADKARAAALAAVPGGTIVRVETDSAGSAYEAHIRKADGSYVTVKLDSSFKATATQQGFGAGGPGGGPAGPPPAANGQLPAA